MTGGDAEHGLNAAEGWLLLGCPDEAAGELARLPGAVRRGDRFLDLSWQVAAAAGDWLGALQAAEVRLAGEGETNVGAWIQRSYALRRAPGGGVEAAMAALAPAIGRFPEEPIIPYNLACYLARCDRLAEAWEMLVEAVRRGGAGQMVPMAASDPDLVALADRIAATWPDPNLHG